MESSEACEQLYQNTDKKILFFVHFIPKNIYKTNIYIILKLYVKLYVLLELIKRHLLNVKKNQINILKKKA